MAGPFTTYAPPGVFTRTIAEAGRGTIAGNLRLPILFATGQETKRISDFQLARGSSATINTLIQNENLSAQFTGTNANFTLKNLPVAVPNIHGKVTKDPNDIVVVVNNFPTAVIQFDGSTGQGILSSIPPAGSTVLATYFFSRMDLLITKQDVSVQANGVRKDFKVNFVPIVDGTDAGATTTDVSKVSAFVNNSKVIVTFVDGANGLVTLQNAPNPGDLVQITYFTNTYRSTSDPLPAMSINKVIRVGRAPGRSDWIEGLDFVIESNNIQWGASVAVRDVFTVVGSGLISPTVQTLLVDNRRFAEKMTGTVDGTNRLFNMQAFPVDGTGRGRVTDDVSKVQVFVGTTLQAALTAGQVPVRGVFGAARNVELMSAPPSGASVYLTSWYNMLGDDVFPVTVTTPGGPGVGQYQLSSQNNGYVANGRISDLTGVTDPNIAIEGVTFPAGFPDIQALPGVAVAETITVTFPSGGTAYTVTSDQSRGSNGFGALNQTYIDARTGTRFTILKGTLVNYNPGDKIKIKVDINPVYTAGPLPILGIPGVRTTVADLTGTAATNMAVLQTFFKSGNEPNVGDTYFITFDFNKPSLPCAIFTNQGDVEDEFGTLAIGNQMSLASSLTFQQGAIALVACQVPKGPDGQTAVTQSFKDAISSLHNPLPGGQRPAIYVPIRAGLDVLSFAAVDAETQSTIQLQNEYTVMGGFPLGTDPNTASNFAKGVNSERLSMLYPDSVIVSLKTPTGGSKEFVVDGSYVAAAYSGLAVSPALDFATPLTNKRLVGFQRLGRKLDKVTQNFLATNGITVLEEAAPGLLNIRDALTTNVSTVLTRIPTVVFTKDEVQKLMRQNLKQFIGRKFVPSITGDVVGVMSGVFDALKSAELITNFGGISAKQDQNDPTILNVSAAYVPIFPLLYIVITFSLRVQ